VLGQSVPRTGRWPCGSSGGYSSCRRHQIGRRLRPAVRRVLPVPLAAERRVLPRWRVSRNSSDGQSVHQSWMNSASSRCRAPDASNSRPSGPASQLRRTCGATRSASSGWTTMSASSLTRPDPVRFSCVYGAVIVACPQRVGSGARSSSGLARAEQQHCQVSSRFAGTRRLGAPCCANASTTGPRAAAIPIPSSPTPSMRGRWLIGTAEVSRVLPAIRLAFQPIRSEAVRRRSRLRRAYWPPTRCRRLRARPRRSRRRAAVHGGR